MNRRRFLKSGALWVPPLFAIGRARGQVLTLSDGAMVSRTRSVAASSSFVLGLNSEGSASDTWGADTAIYYKVTASASGSLSKAYVYSGSTAAGVVKVALYGPEISGLPTNAEQIGVSDSITYGGSAGWYPAGGASISGSVTSGTVYYIVVMISSSSPTITEKHNAGGLSTYYKTASGWYASPPATLSAAGGAVGNAAPVSVYIECL